MKKILVLLALVCSTGAMASTKYYINVIAASAQHLNKVSRDSYVFASSDNKPVQMSVVDASTRTEVLAKTAPYPLHVNFNILSKSSVSFNDVANNFNVTVAAKVFKKPLGSLIGAQIVTNAVVVKAFEPMINEVATNFVGNSNYTLEYFETITGFGASCNDAGNDIICNLLYISSYILTVE